MLVTEEKIIGNRTFIHNYSDSGYFIIREDGVKFIDAMDIPEQSHTYTESDELIKIIPGPEDDESSID